MDEKSLSERDICTKFITPALIKAGWDAQKLVLEEVSFTNGRIYIRGKLTARGARKRADYILYHKANIPIAIIEAKDNNHSVGQEFNKHWIMPQSLISPAFSAAMVMDFFFMTGQRKKAILKLN